MIVINSPFYHFFTSIAYIDNNIIIAASSDAIIRVFNTMTHTMLKCIAYSNNDYPSTFVNSINFNENRNKFLTSSIDGQIVEWNANDFSINCIFKLHQGEVIDSFYCKDSNYCLSCSTDRTIKRWNISTGKVDYCAKSHSNAINSINQSYDEKTIISCSDDGTVKEWDYYTGILIDTLMSYNKPISNVLYTSNNELIIININMGSLIAFSRKHKKIIWELSGHWSKMVYNPVINSLYAINVDDSIYEWSIPLFKQIRIYKTEKQSNPTCISFSANYLKIIVSYSNGYFKEWDCMNGQLISFFESGLAYNYFKGIGTYKIL